MSPPEEMQTPDETAGNADAGADKAAGKATGNSTGKAAEADTEALAVAEAPKKLKRTLKKLAAEGEDPVIIAPALLQRQASEQMLAMARTGMMDKIFSYIVVTKRNVHYIKPGMMWDRV
ncbi:MAG: hypothetical protein LUO89_01870, partial [Methanothrix sp.]|nr:hypothetical protein [Methanothrix sp.]